MTAMLEAAGCRGTTVHFYIGTNSCLFSAQIPKQKSSANIKIKQKLEHDICHNKCENKNLKLRGCFSSCYRFCPRWHIREQGNINRLQSWIDLSVTKDKKEKKTTEQFFSSI